MEQSLQELMRNARAEENTFLYMLHEEARFDQLLFWKYVNSIMELTRLTADQFLRLIGWCLKPMNWRRKRYRAHTHHV